MKISDQALLAIIRMNKSSAPKTYFSQKIFCDLEHKTIELKECEICPKKCIRHKNLMRYYEKYNVSK